MSDGRYGRSWLVGILAMSVSTIIAAVPPSRAAEPLPQAVAAVVDYQRILRDSRAARSIREQVEGRRKLYLDQLSKQEQKLAEEDKALAAQRSVLAADVFQQKRREFETKVLELQKLGQERRRQLDNVAAAALNQVRQALIELIGALSDARGFNLVLPSSELLLFSPKIDITEEVLASLDRKLPSVKVPEKTE